MFRLFFTPAINSDCRTKAVDPAVEILTSRFVFAIFLGVKESSVDPNSPPSTFALHNFAAAFTVWRCCSFNPVSFLFFLISLIVKGFWVIIDKARAVLIIWPPPSK